MTETVEAIRERGGEPVARVVLVDKQATEAIDGVPVYSLVQATRVETPRPDGAADRLDRLFMSLG